tara:strand:+ start:163 stop:408 length:246 start_codon:yes stop_codon:yes gene_type:complete
MENLGLFGGFEYSPISKKTYKNVTIQDFDVKLDSKLYFNTFQNKTHLLDQDSFTINKARQDNKTRKIHNYKNKRNTKRYKK